MRLPILAIALTLSFTADAALTSCRAESGARMLPLIELYTSEGCDSCPAADRWLSTHFPAGKPGDAVAIAFHVDYWDRLGWKDRFASPAYTARQSQTMRANRATFVYTPQVVLQGRDHPAWRSGSPARAVGTAATREPRATLAMRAAANGPLIDVDLTAKIAASDRRDLKLALAYVDSRLVSAVKSGENRGVTLTHDHVVRSFESRPLPASGEVKLQVRRPDEAGVLPMLVAFVQDVARGDVLQTLALPLDNCR